MFADNRLFNVPYAQSAKLGSDDRVENGGIRNIRSSDTQVMSPRACPMVATSAAVNHTSAKARGRIRLHSERDMRRKHAVRFC